MIRSKKDPRPFLVLTFDDYEGSLTRRYTVGACKTMESAMESAMQSLDKDPLNACAGIISPVRKSGYIDLNKSTFHATVCRKDA